MPRAQRAKVGLTSKRVTAEYSDRSSEDDEKSSQPHPTKKRSRKRKLTSCTPCRLKKRSCNRGAPCDQCTRRSEVCLWDDAQPLFNAAAEQEAAALRLRITELDALVAFLSTQSSKTHPSSDSLSPATALSGVPVFTPSPPPVMTLDMTAHDVAATLARLARGESPRVAESNGLSRAAMAFRDARTRETTGSSEGRSLLNNPWFASAQISIDELLLRLPSDGLALLAYSAYRELEGCFSHPIHIPSFERDWEILRQAAYSRRFDEIDTAFLATFFAVLATGLSNASAEHARLQHVDNLDAQVDSWLEAAVMALGSEAASDTASLESVRAGIVLSTHLLYIHPKGRSRLGFAVLAITYTNAASLQLDREPFDLATLSFFEAEDRRRVWWNLYYVSVLSSAPFLGSAWLPISLKEVTAGLPLDCSDLEVMTAEGAAGRSGEESSISSMLCMMQLSVLVQSINARAFGSQPSTYSKITEMDAEMKAFESSLPLCYRLKFDSNWELVRNNDVPALTEHRACLININISYEFIRMHRPWMGVAGVDSAFRYSQLQAIKYSRRLLSIYKSPSCNRLRWNGLLHKAMSASIVLGIEILNESRVGAYDGLRLPVRKFLAHLQSRDLDPDLRRSSSSILEFLIEGDINAMPGPIPVPSIEVASKALFIPMDIDLKMPGAGAGPLDASTSTNWTSQPYPWTPHALSNFGQSQSEKTSYFDPLLASEDSPHSDNEFHPPTPTSDESGSPVHEGGSDAGEIQRGPTS